jgi:hypothetical protein
MKKFLLLTLIFSAVISTATYAQLAQQAPDPAVMLQQMKDKIRPQMVEKTGLTDALADKVIEINFEMRMAASALGDLSEADRTAKIQELKAAKEKKLSELLTPDQLKAVKEFYENMGKSAPQKTGN